MGSWLSSLSKDPAKLGFYAFTMAVTVQFLHQIEHLTQIIQKYVLGMKVFPGLLGQVFDFEWVHLLYNVALWLAILAVWIIYTRNPGIWRKSTVGHYALAFAVVFQAYHVLEHVVKVVQYTQNLANGMVAPAAFGKGILGQIVPVIDLHFWYNTIIITALLISYVAFRPSPNPQPEGKMSLQPQAA